MKTACHKHDDFDNCLLKIIYRKHVTGHHGDWSWKSAGKLKSVIRCDGLIDDQLVIDFQDHKLECIILFEKLETPCMLEMKNIGEGRSLFPSFIFLMIAEFSSEKILNLQVQVSAT